MPKIYRRNCNTCLNKYIGVGKFFCSHGCRGVALGIQRKGIIISQSIRNKISKTLKGRHLSQITKDRMSKARRGKPKKEKIRYASMHQYIASQRRDEPRVCVECGRTNKETKIHLSNKDHKYSRDPNDYVLLCPRCHKRYDLDSGLTKH